MNEDDKLRDNQNNEQPLSEEELLNTAGGSWNNRPGFQCLQCGASVGNQYAYILHMQKCKGRNG